MLGWILGAFAVCFALECAAPGWKLPRVRTWPLRVLAMNAAQLGVVLLAGVTWERWFQGHALLALGESMGAGGGGVLAFVVLGLTPAGGAVYALCTALGEFFIHTNCRTPYWVGYVFQRPEMHCIHHEYGRHRNNYGDIAWWDMLFGTWENPRAWNGRCGFDAEREEALSTMLAFHDVHLGNPRDESPQFSP